MSRLGRSPEMDFPRPPAVRAHQHVRLEVAVLVVVAGDEDGVRIVARRGQATDIRHVRHAGQLRHALPGLAAILRHVDQPVIGAYIDQPFHHRRFAQRYAVPEERRVAVLGDGVGELDAPHHLELVAVQAARQVATDGRPTVAAVVRAEELVRRRVQPLIVVRTDDQRRVPVPAVGGLVRGFARLDVDAFRRSGDRSARVRHTAIGCRRCSDRPGRFASL